MKAKSIWLVVHPGPGARGEPRLSGDRHLRAAAQSCIVEHPSGWSARMVQTRGPGFSSPNRPHMYRLYSRPSAQNTFVTEPLKRARVALRTRVFKCLSRSASGSRFKE